MSTLLKFGLACALALILSQPARAADPSVMKDAARILQICLDNLPDSRAVRSAFKGAGLRHEGVFGQGHLYSGSRWKFLAFTSITLTSWPGPACGVLVDKMTPAEGVTLVGSILKQVGAERTTKEESRTVPAAYAGSWHGKVAIIEVLSPKDAYHLKGSVVAVGLVDASKKK